MSNEDTSVRFMENKMNEKYGHLGMTFDSYDMACRYALKNGRNSPVRLINYLDCQVLRREDENGKHVGSKIIDGAEPHTIGWFVA